MPTRLTLLAAALLAGAVPAAALAIAEYEFPLHGGTGGTTSFDLTCGDDAVLVGVSGRKSQWLDRLTARCVRVRVDGTWSGTPFTRGTAGGTGGTSFGTLDCPSGSAVASVRGRHGWYIHSLELACYDLGAGGAFAGNSVRTLSASASGGDRSWSWEICPGGKPAKGFRGRAGIYLDRIRLVCHSGTGFPRTVALVPGATQLVSPASNATLTTLRPAFTWRIVTHASRYQLCVRRQNSSACDMVSTTTVGLRSRFALGTLYFQPATDLQFGTATRANWSVRACSDAGCGPWSTAFWLSAPAAAAPTPAASFAGTLAPTFRHPRCMNCHAVTATNFGTATPGLPSGHPAVNASTNCQTCHSNTLLPGQGTVNPGWHSPPATMDFRNKSDSQLCAQVKQSGTPSSVRTHLQQDKLVLWAVGDGRLPDGRTATPLAPPTSITSWQTLVANWVNGGMVCN